MMPATSKRQFRWMKGISGGSIEPPAGLSRSQATEYVAGQSPKGLPERAPKKKPHWSKVLKGGMKG